MKFSHACLGLLAILSVLNNSSFAADAPLNNPPITQAVAVSPNNPVATAPVTAEADLVPPIDLLPPSGTPELVPVGGNVTPTEVADLQQAVQAYQKGADPEDFTPLEDFLQQYPQSAYRASVLVNLGELAFHYGYYSKALDYDERAWNLAKTFQIPKNPHAQKVISGAGIRLAGLYADLGRRPELEALTIALEHYPKWGADVSLYELGIQSAVYMHNKPTKAYNCGPYALLNIARARPDLHANVKLFTDAQATPDKGFTVTEVEKLAQDAGLHYAAARRIGDAALPLPSVIHWKAGHYAAVLEEKDGRYHVKDPTFSTDFWISAKALKSESSGVFIIPLAQDGSLPIGWQPVSADDRRLAGRGADGSFIVNTSNQSLNTPPCSVGMAAVGFNLFRAFPYVTDTPIYLPTAYGPPVQFQLSYYAGQIPNQVPPGTSSIGDPSLATWTMNYLSSAYVSNTANTSVSILNADGTTQTYTFVTSYNTTTGNYSGNLNIITGAIVEKQGSGNTTTFIQHFSDGSATSFGNGIRINATSGNYYLLSSISDPQGNALTFHYDSSNRLSYVEDANGDCTNLTYNSTSDYITSIYNDSYGVTANFSYDGSNRLQSIQDPVGIVSNFTYGNSTEITQNGSIVDGGDNFITQVGTPYGNTTISGITTNLSTNITGYPMGHYPFERTLLIKDPAGNYQRVTFGNPLFTSGAPEILLNTSLYFDKHAMSQIAASLSSNYSLSGNAWLWNKPNPSQDIDYYQYATQYTWIGNDSTNVTVTGVPSSITTPIDFSQSPPVSKDTAIIYNTDSNGFPISNQPYYVNDGDAVYQYVYGNPLGKVTQYTDPSGRVTNFNYESNNVDLASVQRENGAGNDTLVAYSNYNTSHEPGNITSASGSVTNITYNGTVGMLPEVVTQLGTGSTALQTTYYAHNGDGTVASISRSGGNISNTTLVYFAYTYGYLPTEVDYPNGTYQNFFYDGLMRINEIDYNGDTEEVWDYTNATINETSQANSLSLNTYTDRLGHTTTYTYDGDGHPLTATDAADRETQYDWCDCGGLASITDPAGHVTSFTYDFAGNVLTKNITVGSSTSTYSYTHNDDDWLSSITYPHDQGNTTPTISYYYNNDGTISGISYGGATPPPSVSFTYGDSAYPRVTGMTTGANYTYYTYGNVNTPGALQVTQITNPYANATLTYGYDALGRLSSRSVMSDNLSITLQSETYAYNGLGQLKTVGGNLGNTTLSYNGTTLQFTGLAYPNGMNTTLGYLIPFDGGWLANITNNATAVGGNTALISNYNYTYTNYEVEGAFYGRNQIATWQQTYPWNSAVAAQASNTTPNQQQLTAYTYDNSGWLTEAKFGQPSGNTTAPVKAVWEDYTYGYDGAGNRLTGNVSGLANPTNISGLSSNLNTTSTLTGNFNTDNSLKYQTRSGRVEVSGTVSKPATVTVNELPARQWSLPGGVQWAFDAAVPLTINGTTTSNVTIRATDALNNVTTHTWTVPTGNVAANFTYDANGDMTSRVNEPGTSVASTANYTWSSIGQLLEVQVGNNTANFTYDGLGRRVALSANIGGNETDEYYIWDGDQIIQKRVGGSDSSNITEDFYTYGYQTVNGGSNITGNYFETKDHLGSIREVVASDGQTVEGRYNYGPWGETTYTDYSGGNVSQPDFGYAGYFRSQYVPGLYFTENRIYDPSSGRWLSRDPIGESGGLNLYGYCFNDPINFYDALGLSGTIGIYSSGTSGLGNHAWISYTPDGGSTTTYGTYGNREPNGLYTNLEKGAAFDASRSAHLNDDQEANLFKLIDKYKNAGPKGWYAGTPCSSFASDAWQAGTGEYLSPYGLVLSTPTDLTASIIKANGGKANGSLPQPQPPASNSGQTSHGSAANSSVTPAGGVSRASGSF